MRALDRFAQQREKREAGVKARDTPVDPPASTVHANGHDVRLAPGRERPDARVPASVAARRRTNHGNPARPGTPQSAPPLSRHALALCHASSFCRTEPGDEVGNRPIHSDSSSGTSAQAPRDSTVTSPRKRRSMALNTTPSTIPPKGRFATITSGPLGRDSGVRAWIELQPDVEGVHEPDGERRVFVVAASREQPLLHTVRLEPSRQQSRAIALTCRTLVVLDFDQLTFALCHGGSEHDRRTSWQDDDNSVTSAKEPKLPGRSACRTHVERDGRDANAAAAVAQHDPEQHILGPGGRGPAVGRLDEAIALLAASAVLGERST